jgi:hypothetical protein
MGVEGHFKGPGRRLASRQPCIQVGDTPTYEETTLADAVAKLAIRSFETRPPAQTIRVDVAENAPRLKHWVMYTAKPPTLTMPQ